MPTQHTLMRFVVLLIICFLLVRAAKGATPSLDTCRKDLVRWEGYRTTPYRDGKSTVVGIGHNLTAHRERVKPRYSPLEIERFFRADLSRALDACRAGVQGFDDLPEEVQLVALSVAFSCGNAGFMKWKDLRAALEHRHYNHAATAVYLSRWYHQVPPARANWAVRTLKEQP